MKVDARHKRGMEVVVAVSLTAALVFLVNHPISTEVKAYLTTAVGVILILFAYFTGMMGVVVGVGAAAVGFVLSLPVIGSMYALIAANIVFFYNRVIGYAFRKLVDRVPAIQKLKYRVETSETYGMIANAVNSFLHKVGMKKVKRIRCYEVVSCPHCMQDIPVDSRVCMHCGKEVLLR